MRIGSSEAVLISDLYPINVKMAKPIGPKFFVGPQGSFLEDRIYKVREIFVCFYFTMNTKRKCSQLK